MNAQDLRELLGNSIKQSISSLLSICGFIVLFSIILSILETSGFIKMFTFLLYNIGIPENVSLAIITGIIELTNGVSLVSSLFEIYPTFSILITSFLLGFGGFSVLLQVYSIISKEEISIKPYFFGKLLQGFFSIIFTYILL